MSTEWLPPLMNLPRSLWRASPTNRGKLSLKPRAIDDGLEQVTNATPTRTTIPLTSTDEHIALLSGSRRSMTSTTGASTATLNMDTKISNRT